MAKDLIFPTAILEQHLVVLGKTGAGKSSALRHIVEHLLSRRKRVCVVDPKGDWYGLKSSADGKGAGFPVILFGDFKDNIKSDVPLIPRSKLDDDEVDLTPAAKHVADLVVSGNRPCVLGMRGWTQGNMTRFWIDFASTVFNGESGELYFVVDEVHNFAPKGKLQSIDAGKCLHWTNRIMNEGRGIGMVNLIASQRPQKVHNDTLTACETLVAMRVVHKADRDAIEDWIKGCGDAKQGADVLNNLAGMKRGEAFVWSPEAGYGPNRVAFPLFETFDSFAPARLQQKVKEEGWASVDLTEVRQKLAAVIEKAKAEDPKELRKQIAELKKQVAAKVPAPAKAVATIKEVERHAIKDGQLTRLEKIVENITSSITKHAEVGNTLAVVAREITAALSKVSTNGHRPIAQISQRSSQIPRALPERKTAPTPRAQQEPEEQSADIGKGALKILKSVVQFGRVTRSQLTLLSGYTQSSRDTYLHQLSSRGLVSYPGRGEVEATELGVETAGEVEAPPTGDELVRWWLNRLPAGQAKIFEAIVSEGGNPVTRHWITEQTGYTQSSRDTYLHKLKTVKLITIPSPGMVAPAEFLFQ